VKKKHDEGFSLVEIMISIVVLAAMVVPTCTALVLATKMNDDAELLMQEQLTVSSVVEQLMAEGIADTDLKEGKYAREFPGVKVTVEQVKVEKEGTSIEKPYYQVTVEDEDDPMITVTTFIRQKGGGTIS